MNTIIYNGLKLDDYILAYYTDQTCNKSIILYKVLEEPGYHKAPVLTGALWNGSKKGSHK